MPVSETMQSARAAGMSGAGVAVADDWSAIFVNPAGIGSQDDAKRTLRGLEIPNVTLGANKASVRLFESYANAQKSGVEAVEKEMLNKDYDLQYARASVFPYITVSRVQLGLLLDSRVEAYRSDKKGTSDSGDAIEGKIYTQERSQASAVAGFSLPYLNSGSAFGVTTRYSARTTNTRTVNIQDGQVRRESDSVLSGLNHTHGLAVDLGLLLRSSKPYIPGFGIALRDLGGSVYRGYNSGDHTEIERTNLAAGLSFDPLAARRGSWRLILTAEGHHLNDNRLAVEDMFRFGTEVRYGKTDAQTPFALRIGHNLRGFSFGASVDALFLKLELGSQVETADGANGPSADRRYYARLGIDLRT